MSAMDTSSRFRSQECQGRVAILIILLIIFHMDTKRDILERVASGDLTPEQAADLLEGKTPAAQVSVEPTGPVAAIKVIGGFNSAKIIGDPSVKTATAEGDHTVEQDGDTYVIRANGGVSNDETGKHKFRFTSQKKTVVLGPGSKPLPVTIRMNPDLPLFVELAAGTMKIQNVRSPITAEVSAGAIKIDGFASPLTIAVAGGAVNASGRLDSGDSTIKCEAGAVKVNLIEGSSVRVKGRAGLGKIVLPGSDSGFLLGLGEREAVVGEGAASLDIEVSMGAVTVTA